jgi:hypothetical protein
MIDVIDGNDHRLGNEFMRLIFSVSSAMEGRMETENAILETETTHTNYLVSIIHIFSGFE